MLEEAGVDWRVPRKRDGDCGVVIGARLRRSRVVGRKVLGWHGPWVEWHWRKVVSRLGRGGSGRISGVCCAW